MEKHKKLLAFVCALAMMMSLLTGFTIVNADNTDVTTGIVTEYDAEKSTETSKVINLYYKGLSNDLIMTGSVGFYIPETLKDGISKVSFTTPYEGGLKTENLDKENSMIIAGFAGDTGKKLENNLFGVLTIELTSAIKEAVEFELVPNKTGLTDENMNELSLAKDNMQANALKVPVWVDPDATPTPTPEVTATPEPTEPPIVRPTQAPTEAPTDEPTPTPTTPVEVTTGIVTEYDSENSTETSKVINLYYKGLSNDLIMTGSVGFYIPEALKGGISKISFTTPYEGGLKTENLDKENNMIIAGFAGDTGKKLENNLFGVLTIELTSAIKEAVELELVPNKTGLTDENMNELSLAKENMQAAGVTIPVWTDPSVTPEPTATPAPTPVVKKELPVSKLLDKDTAVTAEKDETNDVVYIATVVAVKESDGKTETAVYGEDYALKDKDGNVLTANEYTNLLGAYTDIKMSTVIDEYVYEVYSDGVSIRAQLNAIKKDTGNTEVVENGKEVVVTEPTATPTPKPTTKPTTKPTEKPDPTRKPGKPGSGGSPGTSNDDDNIIFITGTPKPTYNVNFTDLGSVDWAQTAINGMAKLGIVSGRTESIFDPNADVTRAEFAKMVAGTFNLNLTKAYSETFSDVSSSEWFFTYVAACAEAGIVNGYENGAFDPNKTISRQEMAVMIYRAVDYKNMDKYLNPVEGEITFADSADIADYAKEAVTALQKADVINGMGDNTFAPLANATRAQSCVMLYPFTK